ncbi:MAG: nuclear transport factor 2 family protein, partial [Bacillota bacterium]
RILLDKTNTFMIASVDGDIRGRIDYLNVDLFDKQGRDLGRSTFLQKLPDGKTLLTFHPVKAPPEELRMEFFGGPVDYGNGHVVLTLGGLDLRAVDPKYTKEYRLNESFERPGYRLDISQLSFGISEGNMQYQLTTSGRFDGIRHGWFYDWRNNASPEGEILVLTNNGHKLDLHLTSPNCEGPYYSYSQDGKALAGRANFDAPQSGALQVSLTNLYGYYQVSDVTPIDGVKERLDINKAIAVKDLSIQLKSFVKIDDETWALDYMVVGADGKQVVDAAVDAGIYTKDDKYRMPFSFFNMPSSDHNRLLIRWQAPPPGETMIKNLVIKVNAVGLRLDDALVEINLDNPKLVSGSSDRDLVMAAVDAYHRAFGQALTSGDVATMERLYGNLQPTGERWDGINIWRQKLAGWKQMVVQKYSYTLEDPIIRIAGTMATVDLHGTERYPSKGADSAGGFSAVYALEKRAEQWVIVKIDEATEQEYFSRWE